MPTTAPPREGADAGLSIVGERRVSPNLDSTPLSAGGLLAGGLRRRLFGRVDLFFQLALLFEGYLRGWAVAITSVAVKGEHLLACLQELSLFLDLGHRPLAVENEAAVAVGTRAKSSDRLGRKPACAGRSRPTSDIRQTLLKPAF
jgi:hypothetical protein